MPPFPGGLFSAPPATRVSSFKLYLRCQHGPPSNCTSSPSPFRTAASFPSKHYGFSAIVQSSSSAFPSREGGCGTIARHGLSCVSQPSPFMDNNTVRISLWHDRSTAWQHRRLCALANAAEAEVEAGALHRNVVDILKERGLVDAITSEELHAAASKASTAPLKIYVGFDPTAESLHLGNLLGIIVLSWFQRCGHIPVALLGGATGRVGDPSGKSVERPLLDEETIERNIEGIKTILNNILSVEDAPDTGNGSTTQSASQGKRQKAVIVNNYDWWKNVSLLDFLRDVGKYARVGTMMAKESVKKRLNSEEGMSYTEFTYQLLQGYDFVHLYRKMGVSVQMGGSDQWGNITAGTDLVRRLLGSEGVAAYGLTWPLLLKSDGSKFGKSEGGAIWLAPNMLSPYKFYQYLFSTPDADVIKFMKILTFMDLEEISKYEKGMSGPDYIPNAAQRRLAEEVTRFVHGEEGVQEAIRATEALAPGAATELDVAALEAIAEDIPSKAVPLETLESSPVVDLAVLVGLCASKGAARRLVQQGGVYLNNEKVVDVNQVLKGSDIVGGKMLLLATGKKNKMLVRVEQS